MPEAPLAAAIQAFAEGIHRIPILSSDDEHKIAHVFTQTDLVKVISPLHTQQAVYLCVVVSCNERCSIAGYYAQQDTKRAWL